MFSSASLHPAAQSITSVSDQELEQANKATAELIMRLLTESCAPEAKKALQYEGALALPKSFKVLGKIAGQEMFSNPEVSANMYSLAKYLDEEKLKELLAP